MCHREYVYSKHGSVVKIEAFDDMWSNALTFINEIDGMDAVHLLAEIDAVMMKQIEGSKKYIIIQRILSVYDESTYDSIHHY